MDKCRLALHWSLGNQGSQRSQRDDVVVREMKEFPTRFIFVR